MKTVRLDTFLVRNGYAGSRDRARRLIESGSVRIGGEETTKPGRMLGDKDEVEVTGADIPYVSRAGIKLESALQAFGLDPAGARCLDIGAATGGFTDALLQHGAVRVTAIDSGSGQLHPRLRRDPRVTERDRTDIRILDARTLDHPLDWLVADVSFIPLVSVLDPISRLAGPASRILVLVKPQFELGRRRLGGGGVVRDARLREEALARVRERARVLGLTPMEEHPVPLAGKAGNQEYFIHLEPPGGGAPEIDPGRGRG